MLSICLTVHNKGYLLKEVLNGIFKNTAHKFELIVVLDNCTDDSEEVLFKFLETHKPRNLIKQRVFAYFDDLFETKANNVCLKNSSQPFVCIIQDDQIIFEPSWDLRMLAPFKTFNDVFAVSARMAHNWQFNEASEDIHMREINLGKWSDVLTHCDHADKNRVERGVFSVRDSVNRGPLMLNREDVVKLGYLDEIYAPQEMDDHDLMFRAKKELGKVCGFYDIGWHSMPEYGGTRDAEGKTKEWVLNANQKNVKIFYERHKEAINRRTIENRKMF